MTMTDATQALLPVEVQSRFWERVEKHGPDDCWPWIGCKDSKGYGSMSHGGRRRRATHISYEIDKGTPFPTGLLARHTCDNPPCVNPAHIIPGTDRENSWDMVERGRHQHKRKTHCKCGLPLSGDNLMILRFGWRRCRTCHRADLKRYKQKRKALRHG